MDSDTDNNVLDVAVYADDRGRVEGWVKGDELRENIFAKLGQFDEVELDFSKIRFVSYDFSYSLAKLAIDFGNLEKIGGLQSKKILIKSNDGIYEDISQHLYNYHIGFDSGEHFSEETDAKISDNLSLLRKNCLQHMMN